MLLVKRFIIWYAFVRLRGEMVLIFLGVVCCLLAAFIFGMRVWYFFTGKVVAGEIVGYASGAKGLYHIMASNYRIRIVYENEIYMVTSIESVIHSSGTIPNKDLWKECAVYFNPKHPKRVSIKGYHTLEWLALYIFMLGFLVIWFSV